MKGIISTRNKTERQRYETKLRSIKCQTYRKELSRINSSYSKNLSMSEHDKNRCNFLLKKIGRIEKLL